MMMMTTGRLLLIHSSLFSFFLSLVVLLGPVGRVGSGSGRGERNISDDTGIGYERPGRFSSHLAAVLTDRLPIWAGFQDPMCFFFSPGPLMMTSWGGGGQLVNRQSLFVSI